ncbi:hypothetical protein DV515_00017526, partial [Chloebia gouldiae]
HSSWKDHPQPQLIPNPPKSTQIHRQGGFGFSQLFLGHGAQPRALNNFRPKRIKGKVLTHSGPRKQEMRGLEVKVFLSPPGPSPGAPEAP